MSFTRTAIRISAIRASTTCDLFSDGNSTASLYGFTNKPTKFSEPTQNRIRMRLRLLILSSRLQEVHDVTKNLSDSDSGDGFLRSILSPGTSTNADLRRMALQQRLLHVVDGAQHD